MDGREKEAQSLPAVSKWGGKKKNKRKRREMKAWRKDRREGGREMWEAGGASEPNKVL